ncbi:MAG: pentapeptide repeat-containing protein [Spirulinaceae cyanobacterium]
MTIGRIVFAISGSLDDTSINRAKLKLIEARLRELSADASIKIIAVEEGSIKIILEGSEDGIKRIQELVASGELTEVEDIPIEYVRPLNDQEVSKTKAKLRLVEAIRNQHNSNLTGADLTGANLIGAYLTGANLTGTNLIGVSLIGVNLIGANLESARVNKAIFGNDAGINETMKAELIQRGAIFEDSLGASVLT